KLFFPIRTVFLIISNILIKLFKLKSDTSMSLSEREIDIAIKLNESRGFIDKDESKFIKNVLRFSKKTAENVMIPRNRAIGVEMNSTIKEAISVFKESGIMRAPVYKNNLDNVVGIIDSRDLIPYIYGQKKGKTIKPLTKKVNFYPESKELVDLLNEFLTNRIQMAVLIDEYGGTSGIVTLSSIVSEVMGESFNLDDSRQRGEVKKVRSATVVDAGMQIDDFNDQFNTDLHSTESETLGGYVLEKLGHLPMRGEFININGYNLIVRNIKRNKIISLEVKKEC
ncbi:MAG: HlyC/CorC family transporter, partial [Spirochaetes bacterium]|nr:HlyC/CorC family transporter [Spirochaetota bacterium]